MGAALARPTAGGPTRLASRLAARIGDHGPLTVAAFMAACLDDPDFGYYRTRDPFGTAGDFITAPEVSQMFGELIGLWCVAIWQAMGSPSPLRLIELGPGRATLIVDALRAARVAPAFLAATRTHLVETSPLLRARQASALRAQAARARWHESLEEVPAGAAIVIANEFLDALPVRQLVRREGAWHERLVGLDDAGRLAFRVSAAPAADGTAELFGLDADDGAILEHRPGVEAIAAALGARAASHPTAALFIDYGHAASATGDTLQAVRAHRHADPLAHPGEADLTAHVDFAALAGAARAHGLAVWGPMAQGAFLLGLGLRQRCDRLLSTNPGQADAIARGAQRLVAPDAMGALFKVLALTDAARAAPPPFMAANAP